MENTNTTKAQITEESHQLRQTPTKVTAKRMRSSPGEQQTINTMNIQDMKAMFAELLDDKMKNLATKTDIEDIKDKLVENANQIQSLKEENAKLREEMQQIKESKEVDSRRISHLENQSKRKNIVIRGLACDANQRTFDRVTQLCNEVLNIPSPLPIASVRKLSEYDGKVNVVVELDTANSVEKLLSKSKNLKGSQITLERDLDAGKLLHKKLMLILKQKILTVSKVHRVSVRNEKLRIGDYWLRWNNKNELVCNDQKGEMVLKILYKELATKIDINYVNLLKILEKK
ncbi:uncharacterized protein LOC119684171 [Teleopsis dalmanni]|uniref:uncharacterized protein LOC119684171 n=1 Tax=Teleopsis dalmanni TaxID=139649 RepID=UPI0018CD50A7|nr:uncharacterized protein LOC119684171 [Teleopsis dalmanni]